MSSIPPRIPPRIPSPSNGGGPARPEVALEQQLKSDPKRFGYVVAPSSAWSLVVGIGIIAGLVLLVRNVISAFISLGNARNKAAGATFFDLFASTTGRDGSFSPGLWLLVWGPLILFAIAIVAALIDKATSAGRLQRAQQAFAQSGFVVDPIVIPVQLTRTNDASVTPLLLVGPTASAQQAEAWAAAFANRLQTSPDEFAAFSKAAFSALGSSVKSGDCEKAVAAETLVPGAPAGTFFKISREKGLKIGRYVAVWASKPSGPLRAVHIAA
ncbi:hypothetical protein F8O06_11075 [Pseudoclavibacter sp. CFCC 14310]|uniref:hypothetical protein n=1 Tax=Pseudoclavibacter sp. CFCC 14310 TaxID=2615180 RepID=UPI00130144B3|nr:hypothetical protein [Pseudoclavibacter sp. CFCC 14310]KAB1644556.1 hypothetical protein F8O06_11075 [Pseudoclavibacter sp. CFCC 14310]